VCLLLAVASESRAERHLQDILIAVNEIPGPTTRSKSTNRRSKEPSPSPAPQPATFTQTPLQSLYLEGMTMDQIWEQLELRTKTVCDVLSQIVMAEDDEDIEMDPRLAAAMNGLEDDEDEDEDAEGDEDMGWEDENIVDGDGVEEESSSEDDSVLGEEVTGLRRGSDEEEDENDDEEEEEAEDGIRMFDLDRPTSSSGKLGRKR
jgi:U3 small nucleolar RNA-associated protein MPP10